MSIAEEVREVKEAVKELRAEMRDQHAVTRRESREDIARLEDGFKGWQEKQDETLKEHDKLHGSHNVTLAEIKTRVFIYAAGISMVSGIVGSALVAFIVKKYA